MKKILFLTTILLANISCQEEEISTQPKTSVPQSPKLQMVQITDQGEITPFDGTVTRNSVKGELALQFVSESAYQSAMKEIEHMATKERLAYTDNFTSLQQLAAEADEELEEIGETANSEADFRKKYAQYVKKYDGKLITNKYDTEDLTLYVPDGDNLATYFVNENRKVVIGDEVKEVTLNNDMSSSEKAVFAISEIKNIAPPSYPSSYSFKKIVDSKKTTGSVEILASSCIQTHVGCQKKMWYGWKRDNAREVYIQLNASPMYYTFLGPYASKGQSPIVVDYVRFFVFENNGNVTYPTGGMSPGTKILSGNLKVWTDMTVEKTQSIYTMVYMDKNHSYGTDTIPTCNPAKAYGGDFTLEYYKP